MRDFGCGVLQTLASGGSASLHAYAREAEHPRPVAEHAYPSHSLVFTDVGQWEYHGREPYATVANDVLIAGTGSRQYECKHPGGVPNACFIVAIRDEAFDEDDATLFSKSVLRVTPEMLAHRRVIERASADPERLESLAFSLYDVVARDAARETRVLPADVRMSYAKRLLRERAAQLVTVASVAAELHLSRFTFTRRFLAHSGSTPHAYLTAVRIERAKKQLSTSALAIEEVALANGFGSISHFSNAFRRIVGCAPSAYRRLSAR